ncbi:hypothetical protein BHE74_00034061 [Ensete ventricosum]|nr:hypothetical protein BHE74_00034061 [Ensete ventricosum]
MQRACSRLDSSFEIRRRGYRFLERGRCVERKPLLHRLLVEGNREALFVRRRDHGGDLGRNAKAVIDEGDDLIGGSQISDGSHLLQNLISSPERETNRRRYPCNSPRLWTRQLSTNLVTSNPPLRRPREIITSPTMEEEKGRHRSSVFFTFMILSTISLRSSHAADTLPAGQSIHDGQTLISASQTFELGFFSPPNSSNRYVGIWYHKLSPRTIVWVGNRERPIPNISGFLTIDAQGTLMILDKIGTSIVIASNTGSTNLTNATLLDSGNLVLKQWNSSQDEQPLWQSFDHPTDTFLPRMKLGLDGKRNRLLTSWRSSDDPGPGDFSAGIDPNGTKQFFLWYKGEVQWQSGVWNGTSFGLVNRMTGGRYNISYTPHWIDGYYYYTLGDSSVITRGVMEVLGQFKQYIWLESEEEWVVLWVQPKKLPCEVPATCGANGLCSTSHDNSTNCRCMYGFVPASYQRWRSNDWSAGCMRQTPTDCERDGFFSLTSVKLPIFSSREGNSSLSREDCKSSCGRDCSCTAFAAAYANGTGCLFWSGGLLGLQDGTQDLYVRLAASDLSQDSGKKKILRETIRFQVTVVTQTWIIDCRN